MSPLGGRCRLAEESEELQAEVRLLPHGKRNRMFKIYIAIHKETDTVRILHVRHRARKPVDADELQDLMDEVGEEDARE
jgi:hypothetical protein